ncbi:Alpha/Beta hydrolase protein [Entophlyctis helioformis]|nr:Alpha/Beta hydrolase protein [Entophlyctis helioformis]
MPFVNVADASAQPVHTYYEVHGSGPQKILLVGGVSTTAHFWDKQIDFFSRYPEFSVCVFDNRGSGHSSAPPGHYSTKIMATDALRLINHLKWRHVNLVGMSLGGMISQELALMLGSRVKSLSLVSTYCKLPGLPLSIAKFVIGSGNDPTNFKTYPYFFSSMMLPAWWLKQSSIQDPPITNHEAIATFLYDRMLAVGPQSIQGLVRQPIAAGLHYCDRRLDEIRAYGYPILVMTGDDDQIILQPSSSEYLAQRLQARLEIYKGGGHGLMWQCPEWHDSLLLETIRKGHNRRSKNHKKARTTGARAVRLT